MLFKRGPARLLNRTKNSETNKTLYKFGYLKSGNSAQFVYPNTFAVQKTTGGDRLVIAPSAHQITLLSDLTRVLPEPFGILYVLLVPREQTNQPGRYESPEPSSRSELESFLTKFETYFESDGRHHIWVMSLPISSTLVYDNHNVIYAYGPLEKFRQIAVKHGLLEKDIQIPFPHTHNYNVESDKHEQEIMAYWNWKHFPLAESDDD